ncbi:MAG: PilZ domain-containing protein [Myxococcota bacterium]
MFCTRSPGARARPSSHASQSLRRPSRVRAEPTQLEHVHDLLDLSAGGIRFRADLDYEPDEEVVCHSEAPGSLCFVLPARVVRPPGEVLGRRKPSVAVEFVGLDENNRSQLLRWVYREQVRRHRQEQRRGARDRDDD